MKRFKAKKLKIKQIAKILGTLEASRPATEFGRLNVLFTKM